MENKNKNMSLLAKHAALAEISTQNLQILALIIEKIRLEQANQPLRNERLEKKLLTKYVQQEAQKRKKEKHRRAVKRLQNIIACEAIKNSMK